MPVKEKYVNQAYLSVTESAPATLTYSKLETGVSIYEKVGWLISRMDYNFSIYDTDFAVKDDSLEYGIAASDQMATIYLINNAVIDYNVFRRVDYGTAASGFGERQPFTKSFADLPGGGLLIPPNPIYIFAVGNSTPNAITVQARMFYTVVQLKADEFWELVEQRRMIGG